MKYKTTKKAMIQSGRTLIKVGYGSLDYLLTYHDANAYTVRAEGWAADIYNIGSVSIVTGYAPFGNISPKYEITQKYEDKAREIQCSNIDWKTSRAMIEVYLNEFITEVTQ